MLHVHSFLDWLQVFAGVILGLGIGGWAESLRREYEARPRIVGGIMERDVADPGDKAPPAPPPPAPERRSPVRPEEYGLRVRPSRPSPIDPL